MLIKAALDDLALDAMLAAARDKAKTLGIAASVAIVDDGGYPLRLARSEAAGKMTAAVALAKARTAALMRAPSGALTARLKDEPELLRLTDYLPMPGGLPVRHEKDCLGGVGVSGGNAEQDVTIAQAALDAII
jgi:glc operon protein GlcG